MAGPEEEREIRLGWSLWRRAHQAVAKVATSPSATFFEEDHPKKCSPSLQQQRCLLPR